MKAIWNGTVIAESDKTIVVEQNHYFPPESVKTEFLTDSFTQTVCPWKGDAHYKNIVVDGKENSDAVWFYPDPKEAAGRMGIKNHLAFWRGVKMTE